MAWKRLLAYSSLEHMGVIALGIGFGTPLALAGVAIHIAAHAIAKSLGFYAATPLLATSRAPRGTRSRGIARTQPVLGATLGHSLGHARRAAAIAAVRQRGADRRRRVRGRDAWAAAAAALLLALASSAWSTPCSRPPRARRTRAAAWAPPGLRGVRRRSPTVGLGAARARSPVAALWLPAKRASSRR